MNFRTTLILLALAVGGGAAYWYRDALAARLGHAHPAADVTPDAISKGRLIRPDAITRIEVAHAGRTVELVREGKVWSLPGGWPTRGPEVQQLIDLLTGLDSRFEPIPVHSDTELPAYGLDKSQQPTSVAITIAGSQGGPPQNFHLVFGEPPERGGNPFVRPTYFRIEGEDRVWRTAPGLLRVLNRSTDDYQKRQLFPDVERVRVNDAKPVFPGEPEPPQSAVSLLDAKRVTIKGPDGAWTIRRRSPTAGPRKPGSDLAPDRLAEDWELAEPVTDRVDPEKLRSALTAVPELWVENFVNATSLTDAGLDKPERSLQVETDKRMVDLLIGKVSREVEKKAPAPPPSPFGAPPTPPPVKETYRYAKLAGNPQLFEVKADKLGDLFIAPRTLRDPQVVRFRQTDARRVEIARPDAQIVLSDERDEAAKADHWKLQQPVKADAEAPKVTELLDRLAELRASGPDVIDKADPKAYGFDPNVAGPHVSVELSEDRVAGAEGRGPGPQEPGPRPSAPATQRVFTIKIGRRDTDKNKVYIQLAGNPRIDAVPDDFLKLFDRPVLVYRGRRVIDVNMQQMATITVQRPGERYRLEQVNGAWKLAEPSSAPADAGKATTLAADLGRLEVVEFVNENPTPEDLAKYGLSAPTLTATITFTDPAKPPMTLQLGKPREGRPEVYARLADTPNVFAVRDTLRNAIDQPSLAFRPLQLWQIAPTAVTAVEVQRGTEKYRLSRDGGGWKLSGPFDAPAAPTAAAALVNQLAGLRVERYESHSAADAAKFGFDKPALKLTLFAEGSEPKGLVVGKPANFSNPPPPPGTTQAESRIAKPSDVDAVVVVPPALAAAADRPALDLIDPELASVSVNMITEVRGTGPAGAWQLMQDNGEWKVSSLSPPAYADQPAIEALLRPWADLRAEKFVAYGPQTDWATYGLDKPAATVTVTLPADAGISHTLSLGKSADGGARYARLDSRPGVAVLPAAVVRDMSQSPLDFVDRKLFAFNPAGLIGLRRTGSAGDLELVRRDDGWRVVKPADYRADQPGMEELAERLGGLRAVRVAALSAADLRPYGLDRPAAVVTLVLKGPDGQPAEKVLQIGAGVAARDATPGGPGERYGRLGDQGAIVVLPGALAPKLVADPIKFRDRAIARFAEADRIFVEHGPQRRIFAKLDGTWKMTEPLTADAEATELGDLMSAVSRLRADELVVGKTGDLRTFDLDPPEARWRFLSGDREVLNLLVGRREPNSGRNYAKLAGGDEVFLLSPDLSRRLFAEYRKRALVSGLDAGAVESLVISAGDKTLTLQKANERWQVAGKPDQPVNVATVTDLLTAVAGLKAERFAVDNGADFKAFGLQPPPRTIVARTRTGSVVTLQLGKVQNGSRRIFARLLDPNRSDVVVLSEADSERLSKDVTMMTK
jgi:hypothetical protein